MSHRCEKDMLHSGPSLVDRIERRKIGLLAALDYLDRSAGRARRYGSGYR